MDIAHLIADRDAGDIISCSHTDSVRDAVKLLAGKRIGAIPVMDGSRVAGIFSERDVLYRLADEGAMCLDRAVGEVMTSPAITCTRDMRADDALGLMTKRRIRHLPVVDGDAMIGFISIGDIVKSRIDEVTEEAEQMRQYIRTA